jgi:hypothetical protein
MKKTILVFLSMLSLGAFAEDMLLPGSIVSFEQDIEFRVNEYDVAVPSKVIASTNYDGLPKTCVIQVFDVPPLHQAVIISTNSNGSRREFEVRRSALLKGDSHYTISDRGSDRVIAELTCWYTISKEFVKHPAAMMGALAHTFGMTLVKSPIKKFEL